MKGDVSGNVAFIDEHNLLYPAGSNLIIYNCESKTQKFIPITDKTEGITSIAVSPNKKYAAVALRGEKATVAVYEIQTLRRRRLLTMPDSDAKVKRHIFGLYIR